MPTKDLKLRIAEIALARMEQEYHTDFRFMSQFPVPPLTEQRRIAQVLDRAEALRAKRRAALAQLDALTQSVFLELFGDLPRTRRAGT